MGFFAYLRLRECIKESWSKFNHKRQRKKTVPFFLKKSQNKLDQT